MTTLSEPPIRVTIVGGYLGAGKTTLVNHVLRSADERVAVIVNDFGSVNIDADLIESTDGDTISLANGCICCSIVDGFGVALDTIRASEPRPDRLLIEASGVAFADQVAAYAHGPGFALDGVVTLVDAETIRRLARDEYVGDVIERQLASTDLLVLNKADLVDDDTLEQTEAWLRSTADAPVVRATNGDVDLRILLDVAPRTDRSGDAPTVTPPFDTWTQSWDAPIARDELSAFLADLPASVVRAKGVVRLTDADPVVVQAVGRRVTVTPTTDPMPGAATGVAGTLVMIAVRDEARTTSSVPSTRDD